MIDNVINTHSQPKPNVGEAPMLLSRVANACFWLSRYRERAEFTARVVDVHLITQLDTRGGTGDWKSILQINGSLHLFDDDSYSLDTDHILNCLCLDSANPNSIMSCVRLARENSRQAREQISSEMWEQVNDLYLELSGMDASQLATNTHQILHRVKNGALLLQGIADQTMLHSEAWHFIRVGRFIERANTTCRLLDVHAALEYNQEEHYRETLYWIAVLKSASSLEAYHKTYVTPVDSRTAVEFLLLNSESPRSILYCLENALESLHYISGSTGRRYSTEADRLLGQMASRLHYLRLEDIDMNEFLAELQLCLAEVSGHIMQTYCSYEAV
jgi:uncharacterized alpha-E superfamily protein